MNVRLSLASVLQTVSVLSHLHAAHLMNLKLYIAFLSAGLLAAGSMVMVFFFGDWFHVLPPRVRIYSLWSPMPMFLVAGSLAGWGCGRGWKSITAFGLASLLPGFWIPTAMMGTQGAHRTMDLFFLTTGIPTATYLVVGSIGGYVSFRSFRAAVLVAAGFAIGAILGPVMAWLLRPMTSDVRLPLSMGVWILPWLGGAWGAGRSMHRQGHPSMKAEP